MYQFSGEFEKNTKTLIQIPLIASFNKAGTFSLVINSKIITTLSQFRLLMIYGIKFLFLPVCFENINQ
jgi:hypothetical protein